MKKKLIYIFRLLFWNLSRAFVYLYLRPKFNLKTDPHSDPMPRPPFIMVANHGTFFDPWLVGHFSMYPLSIMMNEDGFKINRFVQWYLKNIGAFAKKKGTSDYKAMKKTLKMIRDGYAVLIFPEGQTTWDGETQPVFPGVEKILKLSRSSLVMMHIRGNFLSKPWWAQTFRKGQVHIARKVLPAAQLQSMSDEAIRDTIIDYLRHRDLEDTINETIPFHGTALAEGLERFVWLCKQCGAEDTFTTSGNTITCTSCSSSWNMDAHCRFSPQQPAAVSIGTLHDWSLWHKEQIMEKIARSSETETLTTSADVALGSLNHTGKFLLQARGTLTLTKETLRFAPVTEAVPPFSLPVADITDYVFQRKDTFECHCHDQSYRFCFTGHSPMKWVYYFRYLKGYALCEKRGHM
jgi:hypothetical protein